MGKSTLVLQALGRLAASGARCLLVSAEESAVQVHGRAERVGSLRGEIYLLSETSLPAIVAHAAELAPHVVAVDSVQTVVDPDQPGVAGSVSQVREGAQRLVRLAKETGVAVLLVSYTHLDVYKRQELVVAPRRGPERLLGPPEVVCERVEAQGPQRLHPVQATAASRHPPSPAHRREATGNNRGRRGAERV